MRSKLFKTFVNHGAQVSRFWEFYCLVQKGTIVDKTSLLENGRILATLQGFFSSKTGSNGITIFNSQRGMTAEESSRIFFLKMSLTPYHFTKTDKLISLDCNKRSKLIGSMPRAFANTFSCHLIESLLIFLRFGKGALIIYVALMILLDYDIAYMGLFTSNNRLTEALRIAGLISGVYVTEFLHGICCESLEQYYDALEMSNSNFISYVNMYPGLPQPDSITKYLFNYNGRRVCYVNEKSWTRYVGQNNIFDIAIVGNNNLNGVYTESEAFACEVNLVKWSLRKGLSIVYCPHPANWDLCLQHPIMSSVPLQSISDTAYASKVLVGFNSTALFTARELGMNVMIFQEGLNGLPSYMFKSEKEKQSVKFDPSRLLTLLASNAAFKTKSRDPDALFLR